MMCDYAVADLTTANANVFYELGIRHGVRPYSTVLMAAISMRFPFDVSPLRAIRYEIDHIGHPVDPDRARRELTERLKACRNPSDDSPLYQLVADMPRLDIQRLKTDSFRDMVEYSKKMKERLCRARRAGPDAVSKVEGEINIVDANPAIVIDLLLSYRAVEDWNGMVQLAERMSAPLRRMILVQEQLGFALNRLGRYEEAETNLLELIGNYGPSSETNGILGRVYKDQWQKACASGDAAAPAYLKKAIDVYLQGFEADWRDAYPGVNAVTLMEMEDPPDSRQKELIPVVRYGVQRRIEGKNPDYWDYATLLELSVLSRDESMASKYLAHALTIIREPWEPETTASNIGMIIEIREYRGENADWIRTIEQELLKAAEKRRPD